jgi:hypothetical protein
VTEYEKKHTFVGGPGVTYFQNWLKGKATPAEAQLAADIASGSQATTEARAYVRTFIAALDVGAAVEATVQLVAYAKGMASGKIAIPAQADKNPVVVELKGELSAFRRRLGATDRKAFDVAVAAAVDRCLFTPHVAHMGRRCVARASREPLCPRYRPPRRASARAVVDRAPQFGRRLGVERRLSLVGQRLHGRRVLVRLAAYRCRPEPDVLRHVGWRRPCS